MAADSGMEDIQALIPNVGVEEGRQCGRDHTIRNCGEEELGMGDMKQNTHRERERERERHKEYLYYQECNSYNVRETTTN